MTEPMGERGRQGAAPLGGMTPHRPMPERYLVDRLRWLRVQHSYSQEEIALLVNQPRPVISDWERGKRLPHVGQLAQLVRVYNDDWLRGFIASIDPLNQVVLKARGEQ